MFYVQRVAAQAEPVQPSNRRQHIAPQGVAPRHHHQRQRPSACGFCRVRRRWPPRRPPSRRPQSMAVPLRVRLARPNPELAQESNPVPSGRSGARRQQVHLPHARTTPPRASPHRRPAAAGGGQLRGNRAGYKVERKVEKTLAGQRGSVTLGIDAIDTTPAQGSPAASPNDASAAAFSHAPPQASGGRCRQ